MREQRGVTLTSVVIYVMVMTIIVGIITAITAFFYSNTTQMNESATSLGEYNKFNTAFLAEVKKIDNEVYKIENDSQRIIFKSGTMFTFQDGGIYQNRVKICTGVTNCKFSVKEQEEKQIVTVLIEIGQNAEFAKTTDYVLDDTDYQGSNEIQHVHNYKYWRKIDETVHIGICNCGATQEGEHEYGEWIQTTPATCTVAGTQRSTCSECNTTVTRRLPVATGHTGQTHANGGKCIRCQVVYVAHTWGGWSRLNDTSHIHTCSCGVTETATHVWGGWVQTIAATCTVAGTQRSTCSVCGAAKTQSMPAALGHSYGAVGIDQNINGNHTLRCNRCGYTITERHNAVWYVYPYSKVCWACGEMWFY